MTLFLHSDQVYVLVSSFFRFQVLKTLNTYADEKPGYLDLDVCIEQY